MEPATLDRTPVPARRPGLKRRVQQAAFGVAMLVAGGIGLAELVVGAHDLPRAAREANANAARIFGTYLSAVLDSRIGDILQLADSSLVWTALSDSRDRDIYVKPFLEERNRALPNGRLALLDYRGRFVAGDATLVALGGAVVERLIQEALKTRVPAARLAGDPKGHLWIGVPIDYPYTDGAIGLLLGAVDLEATLMAGVPSELRDRSVIIRDTQTQWHLGGVTASRVFAAATHGFEHSLRGRPYRLELEVHSTINPWMRTLLRRGGVLLLVSITLATLMWWIAGVAAHAVSRRLERLAEIIVDNPACGPDDIPVDTRGDEIAVLGDALRQALLARETAQQQLEQLAYFDRLTGLMNRTRFDERLSRALDRAKRTGTQTALLFIDLDRFKAVNDSLGHEAGDALLCEVARRLIERVRSTDAVSRRSGDEFTLLVESCKDQKGAAQFAEELIALLSKPYRLDSGATVVVGASVGIAFYPTDAQTGPALLQCADTAMYAAKERGSGVYCLYSPDLGKAIHERLALEVGLRRAVAEERLEILFQPQVRLTDGRLVGVEALCRWRDETLGDVPPQTFIQIAEETGLIRPLGRWLLREASREVQSWPHESGFFLAVNVSTAELSSDFQSLVRELVSTCRDKGVRLELELSELALIQAPPDVAESLAALSDLGVSLVMDNFGAHYSAFCQLKRFRLHKLKIDLSLTGCLMSGREDALMVRALIDLAHELGLEVLAEGVETGGQRDRLQSYGCELGQGYLFGPPLTADALRERFGLTPCAVDRAKPELPRVG